MSTITTRATWRSVHIIDVPDGVDRQDAIDIINVGELPEWVDITSQAADLTDWSASA